MSRKGSTNLTRLSGSHVNAFRTLLPDDLRSLLDDLIAISPYRKKYSLESAKKHAWLDLKKRAPDVAREVEADYFRVRAGSPKTVLSDFTIVDPVREDVTTRASRAAATTEEAARVADAFGAKVVPLPATVEDGKGRTVAHPIDGKSLGWGKSPNVNFRQTISFVAEYLYRADVKPEDCPSGTAWGMLCWARRGNETRFFSDLYKCMVPSSNKIASDEERRSNEAGSFEDALEMLEKAMQTEDDVDDVAVRELLTEEQAALAAAGFGPEFGDED